jgi:hypothetical protein
MSGIAGAIETRTILFDADGRPLIVAAAETGRTVEIARSFSYKLNLANVGGPADESIDVFCSEKTTCREHEAEDASEALYQFCRNEVTRAANEVRAKYKQPARKTA